MSDCGEEKNTGSQEKPKSKAVEDTVLGGSIQEGAQDGSRNSNSFMRLDSAPRQNEMTQTAPPGTSGQRSQFIGAIAVPGFLASSEQQPYLSDDEDLAIAAEVATYGGDLEERIDRRIESRLNRITVNATNVAPLDNNRSGTGEAQGCSKWKVGLGLVFVLVVIGVVVGVVVPLTTKRDEASVPVTAGGPETPPTPPLNTTSAPSIAPANTRSPTLLPTISSPTDLPSANPPPSNPETMKPTKDPTFSPTRSPIQPPTGVDPTLSPTPLPTTPQPRNGVTSPAEGICGFTILNDTDLLGSDITNAIPLTVTYDAAIQECSEVCTALPSCAAFTLVDAGAQPGIVENTVPWCFVKNKVPSASDGKDMTSGVKTTEVCDSSETTSYTTLTSTDLFGNDYLLPCIPLKSISRLDEATRVCQDICTAMSDCRSFSAVDPRIGILFQKFSCCIKYQVSNYELGSEPLVNSGIKL